MLHILYKILAAVILVVLFSVALGGVSQHNKWRIDTIKVSGVQVVSEDAVRTLAQTTLGGNYFFLYARDNSFLFPRRELEAQILETFPRVRSVVVEREDTHTITIDVVERKPFMLWCGESFEGEKPALTECWFIDDQGFVFSPAPVFSEGVYREIYASLIYQKQGTPLHARIPSERFYFVYSFIEGIERGVGDIARIFIKAEGQYGVVVRSSKLYPELVDAEIYFKDGQSAERLMYNILSALPVQFPPDTISEKKLLYVDLRFGNKVFFGFEEGKQQQ